MGEGGTRRRRLDICLGGDESIFRKNGRLSPVKNWNGNKFEAHCLSSLFTLLGVRIRYIDKFTSFPSRIDFRYKVNKGGATIPINLNLLAYVPAKKQH